jgi:hypothetical protein
MARLPWILNGGLFLLIIGGGWHVHQLRQTLHQHAEVIRIQATVMQIQTHSIVAGMFGGPPTAREPICVLPVAEKTY